MVRKHKVRFLQDYETSVTLGALERVSLSGGERETIEPAGREMKISRKTGEITSFNKKADAEKFVKAHPPGVCELVEEV